MDICSFLFPAGSQRKPSAYCPVTGWID